MGVWITPKNKKRINCETEGKLKKARLKLKKLD